MLLSSVIALFATIACAGDATTDFLKDPTQDRLASLRTSCKAQELNTANAYGRLHDFVKDGSTLSVRALISLHEYCPTPEFSADLIGVLGRDLWLAQPAHLVEALAAEKASGSLIEKIARSRGIPEDAQGTTNPQAFYQSKAQALAPLQLKGAEEKIRLRMLRWIELAGKAAVKKPEK